MLSEVARARIAWILSGSLSSLPLRSWLGQSGGGVNRSIGDPPTRSPIAAGLRRLGTIAPGPDSEVSVDG
jgi:hypothetical protein